MQLFWHDFVLLLTIDVVLFGLVRVVAWLDWNNSHGEVPFMLAIPLSILVVVAHFFAALMIAPPDVSARDASFYVMISVVCGLLPITSALLMLCSSWVSWHAHTMHGWMTLTESAMPEDDWSRARTMKRNRDVVGALRQYRRYFNENPVCPRPLFEAEHMLEAERCYQEALDLLREILRRFGHDDVHWVEASYRLAHVLEVYYRDFETSHYLLRKIIERCPTSQHAVYARRLLAERDVHLVA